MSARTVPVGAARDSSRNRIAHLLATTSLIVLVLGVLPFVWRASAVWQIVGPVVCLALVANAATVIWREVFSTDPRHLSSSA